MKSEIYYNYVVSEADDGEITITSKQINKKNNIVIYERQRILESTYFSLADEDIATLYGIINSVIIDTTKENNSSLLEAYDRAKDNDIAKQICKYLTTKNVDNDILEGMKIYFNLKF